MSQEDPRETTLIMTKAQSDLAEMEGLLAVGWQDTRERCQGVQFQMRKVDSVAAMVETSPDG